MGGRQSSPSLSSASVQQAERGSPQRRATVLGTSSTGASSSVDGAGSSDLGQEAASILQRLQLANASRPRSRASLSSSSLGNRVDARRTRSRVSVGSNSHNHADDAREATYSDSDEEEEEDDDDEAEERVPSHRSISIHGRNGRRMPFRLGLFPVQGIKCPICKQNQQPSEFELHLVMCLTKPRITYNEDVLTADKDEECAICLEDLQQGNTIARLPCLCVFHKRCVDDWFQVRQMCPNHPGD